VAAGTHSDCRRMLACPESAQALGCSLVSGTGKSGTCARFWALDKMREALDNCEGDFLQTAWEAAAAIVEEDVETCRMIGVHGLPIIEEISKRKNGEVVNILTHCNAGMLGCVEWGTITSPIYQAMEKGLKVHVWVDETRPRNQGSNLTTWYSTYLDSR